MKAKNILWKGCTSVRLVSSFTLFSICYTISELELNITLNSLCFKSLINKNVKLCNLWGRECERARLAPLPRGLEAKRHINYQNISHKKFFVCLREGGRERMSRTAMLIDYKRIIRKQLIKCSSSSFFSGKYNCSIH